MFIVELGMGRRHVYPLPVEEKNSCGSKIRASSFGSNGEGAGRETEARRERRGNSSR